MSENKTTLIVLSLAIFGILITTAIGWYVIHQVQVENQVFQEKVFSQYEFLLADLDIERRVLLMEFNQLMKGVQEISQASMAYWATPVSKVWTLLNSSAVLISPSSRLILLTNGVRTE